MGLISGELRFFVVNPEVRSVGESREEVGWILLEFVS